MSARLLLVQRMKAAPTLGTRNQAMESGSKGAGLYRLLVGQITLLVALPLIWTSLLILHCWKRPSTPAARQDGSGGLTALTHSRIVAMRERSRSESTGA